MISQNKKQLRFDKKVRTIIRSYRNGTTPETAGENDVDETIVEFDVADDTTVIATTEEV